MSYRGRATTVGNSRAISLEAALFRAHPEFSGGTFRIDAIGHGVLIVRREDDDASPSSAEDDPVLAAFLSLIEDDMKNHPERIQPLDAGLLAEAAELTEGVEVEIEE